MEQNFENDFNVLYENNSTSNYLVLRTSIDKTIVNYQAQMLLNNKINGLLEFNINYMEGGINCFYNVTSKCTLASFMSRKHFSRDEFLITILNIINNIYQLKNYLLYDSNILLNENFIYVEPESIDIYFVYLPFKECKTDIRAFFMKLIVKLVKFHNEDSDNYVQKILEVIKNDLFNLSNLKVLIENLLGEEIKKQALNNSSMEYSNTTEDKVRFNKNTIENVIDLQVNSKLRKTEKLKGDKSAITRGNVKIPKSPKIENREQKNSNVVIKTSDSVLAYGKKSSTQNKNKLIPFYLFLLQLFILITLILILNSSFVKMSESPQNTVIILIIIFLCVDVLLIRIINEKRNKTDPIISYKPLQFITNKMKSIVKPKEVEKQRDVKDRVDESPPIIIEKYSGETVILKKSRPTEKPYLKEKDGEEVVEIDKKSLLVGRMESFVDYVVNSNAVGKIHAEIIDEGGDFFVMDCNSRNGTFLNDSRIVPNTKNKVCDKDVLRFANKEFIFSYPGKSQRSKS